MDVQEYTVTKAAADSEAPTGAWSGAPSLAASTVEMQNTSGYPVWVDVVGGTVTVIEVEDETTGLTAGSFLLQDMQSIAITYSSAPAVHWRFQQAGPWAPSGVWAGAPSLASSTVDMVNTSGFPVDVYIAGSGTITVVKVDGATTGLVSTTAVAGKVRLRPNGVLNITYSVAPTLHWIYA